MNAVNTALRNAARELLEQSRSIPAPCGCAPQVRCDKHCRVKIQRAHDDGGHPGWVARCNGRSNGMLCTTGSISLPSLHDWATNHIINHRKS
jgi:hypothetical protein